MNQPYEKPRIDTAPPGPPGAAAEWLPAEGAWLYVIDRNSHDNLHGHRRGIWVPADLDAATVAQLVSLANDRIIAPSELVVIDQVGIDVMVDEDHFTIEATR